MFLAQAFDLSQSRIVIQAPLIGERCEEMASTLLPNLPPRFALVGASLGGTVALEILRKAPERVKRLCLIATDVFPDAPEVSADREPLLVQARAGRFAEAVRATLPPEALAPGVGRAHVLETFAEMAEFHGLTGLQIQTRAIQRRRDHQSTLYRAQCPVQIIAGQHDTIVTPKRQAFMAELAPRAEFTCLETAGHLPTLEDPGAVAHILRDWLEAKQKAA
ncbi:alpha/beta fold hydrolase [Pseudooceanicola sp.]